MRYFIGLVCVLALSVMPMVGCSDNEGTGGTGGAGGTGGTGGSQQSVGFAYVANTTSNNVSQYSIGTDGTLTPLDPDEVDAGRNLRGMTTVGALQ